MPRRKVPVPLQELSIHSVVSFLKELNIHNRFEAKGDNIVEDNPFQCFPNAVIQSIIKSLSCSLKKVRVNFIHKQILKLLISRNLEYLDLTSVRFQEKDVVDIINHLAEISGSLKKFSLLQEDWSPFCKNGRNVNIAMINLLSTFTNITELYLHGICCDEMLDTVGKNCHELQVLLAHSEHITDRGLMCLCIDVNNPMKVERCQKLQKISIDYQADGITMEGIKFLLEHLPNLVEVEGWKIGHVLEKIHQSADVKHCYKLQQFSYDWRKCNGDMLQAVRIAVKACSFITCLKLVEPTNDTLLMLSQLSHLSSITIITYTENVTFESSVSDMLKRVGHQITHLSLSMRKVDLSTIDECCPNLQVLECSIVEEVQRNNTKKLKKEGMSFVNLKDVIFHSRVKTALSGSDIQLLLSHCRDLKHLYISCCSTLTDQTLLELLRFNPLLHLSSIYLLNVENLSEVGLRLLIGRESELKCIMLFDTAGVLRATLDNLKQQISAANLDLTINDDY